MKKWRLLLAVFLVLALATGGFIYNWYGGFAATVTPTPAAYSVTRQDNRVYFLGADASLDKNTLEIVAPEGQTRAPVVILLHGGGWTLGFRQEPELLRNAEWFAQRGVVAVPLGYRLSPYVTPREMPWDVANGIAWVYQHIAEYGGDPERIVLLGHSAGGHLASLVACDRHYLDELGVPAAVPAGVITVSAVFDLRERPGFLSRINRRVTQSVFGTDPVLRASLSPVLFARPGLPPFLILHARGEHLVRSYQPREMAAAIRGVGGEATILVVNGRTHVSLFEDLDEPGDLAGEMALKFIREIEPRGAARP